MFTSHALAELRPLEPDNMGMAARLGRMLESRDAQVMIKGDSLVVIARNATHRNDLRASLAQFALVNNQPLFVQSLAEVEHTLAVSLAHRA